MNVYYVENGKRGGKFHWSEETRWVFTKIAEEFEGKPDVRVGVKRTGKLKFPPAIAVRGARGLIVVVAFGDGIALRLNDEDKQRALQIVGARELGRGDPFSRRKMISLPWSAHEHWREYIYAAVNNALDHA